MTYFDRFNSSWQKILFRPDKKSQAAEFNEIQSLVNYQQTQAFDYLFSNYRIIKGLEITVDSFTSTGYLMKVSSGQVFIRKQNSSYFINIDEQLIDVPYNSKTSLGVNPIFSIESDYKDPLIGGNLYGDLGADRLVATSNLIINGDSFPIATIEGKSLSEYPYIFYYNSEGYSLQNDSQYITSLVADYLALRLYEESGNFIAEGLELSISTSNSITVAPGKAYIKGKLIKLSYPSSFKLSRVDKTYFVYLTKYGGLIIENSITINKPDTIFLGMGQMLNGNLSVLSTKSKPVINSDLKLLRAKSLSNQNTLLDNLLSKQSIGKYNYQDFNLSGLFVDSFINLSNSDVTSVDYNASIIPKYGILRSGLTITTINFSNLIELSSTQTQVINKSGLPYYLTPTITDRVCLEQTRATGFLTLTNAPTKASIIVNPPNGQPNKLTKEYQSLQELEPFNSYQFQSQTLGSISITSTLETTLVTVDGIGFKAKEDNLRIIFGNIQISEFTIVKGGIGSNVSTIKAADDGSFSVTFKVPNELPYKQYTITVTNSTTAASVLFKDSGSQLSRFSYNSSVAQTFTVASPITINAIKLSLRSVPFNAGDINLALVSIVKTTSDIPSEEIVGQGFLKLTDVELSSDGTGWSLVNFEVPVSLSSTGQYAFVISPLVQPIEIYFAEVGKRSLSSTSISDSQPLTGGELLIKSDNQWVRDLSKDITFQLIQAVPTTSYSEIVYRISNPLGNIHFINKDIKAICPPLTKVDYFYKGINSNWIPLNSSQPIEGNKNEVDIKITLSGTDNMFPLVALNQSCFTIHENKKTGTWVSKTIEYRKGYKNVEVEFDYYKPTGTDISVLISSNSGQTWQALTLNNNSTELLNGNIPLYKSSWITENLEPTTVNTDINGNTSRILRTKLTLKIEFTSKSPELVPYVMKLKGVVY